MAYSDKVIDHYENPRNVGVLDKNDETVGTGLVGAPACGDVMRLQIRIGEDGVIQDAKFKTFGCGSAIASSSLATEWLKGRTLEQALEIRNRDIAQELNLPPVKIHCSVLAEDAIKSAIEDFRRKQAARRGLARSDEAVAGAHAGQEASDAAGAKVRLPQAPASQPARADLASRATSAEARETGS
jgi:nitrogen fixation NifU-like protein